MKEIKLTQGKVALVDDDVFEELNKYKWCACWSGWGWYAVRAIKENGKQKTIYMHREILRTPAGTTTDHVDGNGLNDLRSNLRTATDSLNQHNQHKLYANKTSKFRGVSWDKKCQNWRAQIKLNGIQYFLGRFSDEKKASEVYEQAKKTFFAGMAESSLSVEIGGFNSFGRLIPKPEK